LAQDLRRGAAEASQMPGYTRKMLDAAAELERQARQECAIALCEAPMKNKSSV